MTPQDIVQQVTHHITRNAAYPTYIYAHNKPKVLTSHHRISLITTSKNKTIELIELYIPENSPNIETCLRTQNWVRHNLANPNSIQTIANIALDKLHSLPHKPNKPPKPNTNITILERSLLKEIHIQNPNETAHIHQIFTDPDQAKQWIKNHPPQPDTIYKTWEEPAYPLYKPVKQNQQIHRHSSKFT